ncbi:unnamed protein product [Rotaria sp. Silwood2]|nr:unnamed protein product [Rotaria sp. Silwood2]CAF4101119.1 unnamed protein product [Rotaria sp. Silwood2]
MVDHFLVEEWLTQESYDEYFRQCAPISCTYLTTVHDGYFDVLKTLIGLLGGLCSGLGIVVPLLVRLIRQRFWPPPASTIPIPSTPSHFSRAPWNSLQNYSNDFILPSNE